MLPVLWIFLHKGERLFPLSGVHVNEDHGLEVPDLLVHVPRVLQLIVLLEVVRHQSHVLRVGLVQLTAHVVLGSDSIMGSPPRGHLTTKR